MAERIASLEAGRGNPVVLWLKIGGGAAALGLLAWGMFVLSSPERKEEPSAPPAGSGVPWYANKAPAPAPEPGSSQPAQPGLPAGGQGPAVVLPGQAPPAAAAGPAPGQPAVPAGQGPASGQVRAQQSPAPAPEPAPPASYQPPAGPPAQSSGPYRVYGKRRRSQIMAGPMGPVRN